MSRYDRFYRYGAQLFVFGSRDPIMFDPDTGAMVSDPIPNPAYDRLRRVRHTCGQVVEQAWSETANGHWRCIDDHGAALHDCPRCGRALTRGKLQVVADYIAPGEATDDY